MQRRSTTVIALAALVAAVSANTAAGAAPRTPAQVARAWSHALNTGNDKAAGALFARNAVTIQGPLIVRLNTPKSAALWNSGLPCSGQIVRLRVSGNVAVATFVLGHRKGHKCDAPGQLAAAKFTIVRGKIARWEQVAPENPGTIA